MLFFYICVLFRCRSQLLADTAINNLLLYISQFNIKNNNPIAEFSKLASYVKTSLGYTGGTWTGCIGDLPHILNGRSDVVLNKIAPYNSSTSAESHFSTYYTINSGRNDACPSKMILEGIMGVYPNGDKINGRHYFRTMEDLEAIKTKPLLPTDIRLRRMRGTWLVLLEQHRNEDEDHYIEQVMVDERTHLYFVKCGVKDILPSSSYDTKKVEKESNHIEAAAKMALGTFDLKQATRLLIPDNIPTRDGFYTVDIRTGVCYLCLDYVKRGCLRCLCKHAYAALLWTSSQNEKDNAFGDFFKYLHYREKSNIARCRDPILYNGNAQEVILHLKQDNFSSCSFKARCKYDVDCSQFPERPDVFLMLNVKHLYEHCLLGFNRNQPIYFVVTGFKLPCSAEFFISTGLVYEDKSKADGHLSAMNILTFPNGASEFPEKTLHNGEVVHIFRVLQPAEARRVRATEWETASHQIRVPGNGRANKRKHMNTSQIDPSRPTDLHKPTTAHWVSHRNHRPSQLSQVVTCSSNEMDAMAACATECESEFTEACDIVKCSTSLSENIDGTNLRLPTSTFPWAL